MNIKDLVTGEGRQVEPRKGVRTPREIFTADCEGTIEMEADKINKYKLLTTERADKELTDKPRWDLEFRYAFDDIIAVMSYGATKYADRNWEKGLPWRTALGALMRHIRAFRAGETIDPESNQPHMAHAAWWCCALLDWMRTHKEYDDRPIRLVSGTSFPDSPTAP